MTLIAVPIPDLKTTTIAHAVATFLFSQYGAPRYILIDRGGSFVSKLMKHLERLFNVKQIVLTDYMKHYADDYGDWDRLLPFAMFAYNTWSVHGATNFTPYVLVFGRLVKASSSFPQGIELVTYGSYLRDRNARPLNGKIGDHVYVFKEVRDGKFESRATGPYKIVSFTENNNAILETETGERFSKHKEKLRISHC